MTDLGDLYFTRIAPDPSRPVPWHSEYIDMFWLPTVGPSSLCVWRHLNRALTDGTPFVTTAEHLSVAVGLGWGGGKRNRIGHTLDRMVRWGLCAPVDGWEGYGVHAGLPRLTARQLNHLPDWLQACHATTAAVGPTR